MRLQLPRWVRVVCVMESLFDLCVRVVLHSPSLSEKASLHLPQTLSHYVLFEACRSKNFAAIEKLVEAWSHPNLSFDFLAFPFCRRRRELSRNCLLAPEYFDVYSSLELAPCITSVAVGLFNNVRRQVCHLDQNSGGKPHCCLRVEEVDISCIHTSLDDSESICIRSVFPCGTLMKCIGYLAIQVWSSEK